MTENSKRTRRLAIAGGAVALAVAAAAGVLYGKASPPGKAVADCPAASAVRSAQLAPLARGEIAALAVARSPKRATPVAFDGPDGRKLTLEDFRGRALVLNLWATWCVPCRAEMPALDRLQAKAGAPDFEVVAINVDTARLERREAFLNQIGVKSLTHYADPSADAFESLRLAGKALGLPTSLLIGPDGCELAVMAGPAQWDSGDAAKLVTAMIGK